MREIAIPVWVIGNILIVAGLAMHLVATPYIPTEAQLLPEWCSNAESYLYWFGALAIFIACCASGNLEKIAVNALMEAFSFGVAIMFTAWSAIAITEHNMSPNYFALTINQQLLLWVFLGGFMLIRASVGFRQFQETGDASIIYSPPVPTTPANSRLLTPRDNHFAQLDMTDEM